MATRTKVEAAPLTSNKFDFSTGDLEARPYVESKAVETSFGPRIMHVFKLASGEEAVVFGQAHLTRLLKGLEGKDLDIVSTGRKIKTKSGGAMNEYELYIVEA